MSLSPEILRHAREAGAWARQASRGLDACPMYAMGAIGSEWRKEWVAGWEFENSKHPAPVKPVKKPTPIKRGRRK